MVARALPTMLSLCFIAVPQFSTPRGRPWRRRLLRLHWFMVQSYLQILGLLRSPIWTILGEIKTGRAQWRVEQRCKPQTQVKG